MSQGGSGVTAVPGMARTRSGSRSSVLPSSSVAATATGTGTGPTSPWRASGSPSPTAGLGISSPLYMAARTSPIGPPPREALPSLPNGQGQGQGASARYGDNEEEHRDSSAHARGGAASGMHAMANSRPVTAVWESASGSGNGPSPPAATTVSLSTATASRGDGSAFAWVPSAQTGSYAGNGAGDGHRQSPSAARRTMGSSPPTAAAYTRSSTYGPRTAAPQQQLPSIPFASTSSSSPPRASEGHPSSRTGRSSNGASGLATNANSTSPPAPAFARHLSADREVPRHNGYSTPRHTAAETHAQTLSNQASVSSLASTAASYYTPNTSATDITAKSAGDGKDEAAQPLPSKSVLTIALQKAQSAVLLDSAQNEEAAVAAYTQSVRLLRDVMTRVEETAGLWRVKELEKLNALKQKRKDRRRKERLLSGLEEPTLHGANGYDSRQESEDDETAEERREREKREAKLEKREKMRLDESRRLKVIHDTYEERIRVLSADIAERLRIDTLSSDAAEKANQTAASLHASRVSEKQQRHLPEPATSDAVYMTPSRPSTSSERSQDSARAGIGSAMLFNTPISPVAGSAARSAAAAGVQVSALPFPDSPTQSAKRRSQDYHAQTLAKPYQVGPMHADALSQAGRPISATFADMPSFKSDPEIAARQEKRRSRQRTAAETAGVEQSSISFSPDSQSSQFDIVDGQARHSAQFAEGLPDSPNSSSFRSAQHRKKPSTASSARSFNKSPPTSNLPHFAATASQQRDAEEDAEEELYQEAHDGSSEAYDVQPSELATPTPDTQATFASRSRKASSASSNGAHSASNAAAARSRAGSQASATTAHSSLARMTSSESLSSTTSSAFSHGNWPTAATQKVPLPPLPAISSASSSSQRSSVLQPMTRPARSASLAAPAAAKAAQHAYTGPAMDRRPSADKPASSASLLVNPSTSQGTISQRRKSPQVQDAAVMPGYDNSAIKSAPPLQRRGSASRQQHQQKQQPESADDTRRRSIIDGTAFNAAGSLPMRLRALSQPGSKRPNLQSYNSEYAQLPAVPPLPFAPQMVRADSDPTAANQSQENGLPPLTPASTSSSGTEVSSPPHQHAYRSGGTGRDSGELVSPVSSTYTMYLQQQQQSSERQAGRSQHMPTPSITSQSFLEPDTPATASFHSSASLLSSGTSHAGHSVTAYTSQASASLTPSLSEYHPPPADALRRPYHFLRQLRSSILTGAYLTQRLYVPKQLWQQGSVKLIHIETKVRMLDLLLSGLEGIERLGDLLLLDTHANIRPGNASSRVDSANRLAKELESFEGMLDGVQSTLSKKLGYIEAPGGKKGGQSSFGAWSSKLSRSMVTMTKGKNLDAPETYVAALARLCLHSQILDRHIQSLHHASAPPASSLPMSRAGTSQSTLHPRTSGASSSPPKSSDASPSAGQSGYADLSPEMRSHVEGRLRRTSEFFEKTLCRMILVDLGIWLEKYSKKGAGWAVDT